MPAALLNQLFASMKRVALEIVNHAVDIVRAGLGDHVDHAAGCAAELGVVAVGLNLEFLHGIDRRIDDAAVDVGSRVGRAIEQQFLRTRASAADVEVGLEEVAAQFLAAAVAEVGAERHAGSQTDQRQRVADIQRQTFDRPRVHDLSDARGLRLQRLGGSGDHHLFRSVTDLQV